MPTQIRQLQYLGYEVDLDHGIKSHFFGMTITYIVLKFQPENFNTAGATAIQNLHYPDRQAQYLGYEMDFIPDKKRHY